LIGIVLTEPTAKELAAKLQENGILVNAATDSVIRLAPPLIVTKKEITRFVEVFSRIVLALVKNRSGVRP
jgi:acetylornithine aminotransferase